MVWTASPASGVRSPLHSRDHLHPEAFYQLWVTRSKEAAVAGIDVVDEVGPPAEEDPGEGLAGEGPAGGESKEGTRHISLI